MFYLNDNLEVIYDPDYGNKLKTKILKKSTKAPINVKHIYYVINDDFELYSSDDLDEVKMIYHRVRYNNPGLKDILTGYNFQDCKQIADILDNLNNMGNK